MKEVAFDLVKHYPPVEPEPFAKGHIRMETQDFCLDAQHGEVMHSIALDRCGRGEQSFQLTHHRDMRLTGGRDHYCLDVPQHSVGAQIVLYTCHNAEGNQLFKYDMSTGHLYHPNSRMCVDADVSAMRVRMMTCDSTSDNQRWKFDTMNQTALADLWRYAG